VRNDTQRWQIIQGFNLEWVCLEDDVLLYHHGTRNVHLLPRSTAQALRSFEQQPLTLEAVRAKLKSQNSSAKELSEKQFSAMIKQLSLLCLIEPCLS